MSHNVVVEVTPRIVRLAATLIGVVALLFVVLNIEREGALVVLGVSALTILATQINTPSSGPVAEPKFKGLRLGDRVFIPPLVQYFGIIFVVLLVLLVLDLTG